MKTKEKPAFVHLPLENILYHILHTYTHIPVTKTKQQKTMNISYTRECRKAIIQLKS